MVTRTLATVLLILAIIVLGIDLIAGQVLRDIMEGVLRAFQDRSVEAYVACHSPEVFSLDVDGVIVPKASVTKIDVLKRFKGALNILKVRVDAGAGSVDIPVDLRIPEGIPPLVVWGFGSAKLNNVTIWVKSYFDAGTTMWGEKGSVWVFIENPIDDSRGSTSLKNITLYLVKTGRGAANVTLKVEVKPGEVPVCPIHHSTR
ncbi:MAG: hypothetical protein P3X22_005265 [Thermoprotei archaeon]|nr:hypothetical protein [Thermoprotei archaeon]